jgi:hypothetical protein
VAGERRQLVVEGTQAGEPASDIGTALGDERGQLGGRLRAVAGMTPARDPGRIRQGHIQPPELDEQPQVLDILLVVLAICVVATGRTRQPPRPLVEAHGVGRHPDLAGELSDPHAGQESARDAWMSTGR